MSGEQTETLDYNAQCPRNGNYIEGEQICHRPESQPFGENVGFFDELLNEGSTYTPEEDWYDDQVGQFNFMRGELRIGTPKDGSVWQFAQTLWDETREIGCAESWTESAGHKQAYVTCRYNPPLSFGGFKGHVHDLI